MEFSRQEYWSELPFPSPGDLPNPGIKPRSPTLRVDSLPVEPQGKLKNTGVSSLSLLQRIFPTQELNWGLLNCRQILYQLSHKGSPRILEWVAYPFSSRSSQPRNRTGLSCISGGFFTNWAIREAPMALPLLLLSRFSRVRLCATPLTPPSLGFSRQEHWSGLPFPSPMHESEKWKWSCSVVSNS